MKLPVFHALNASALTIFLLPICPASGADGFEAIHALVKPRAGESRWMEVDWYPSVWEGRKVAAAEGKPLFLMAGSGGAPPAGC
ncbi:hypothetical protein BH23VER1_BH23VER1_19370 [soil metagenome]